MTSGVTGIFAASATSIAGAVESRKTNGGGDAMGTRVNRCMHQNILLPLLKLR